MKLIGDVRNGAEPEIDRHRESVSEAIVRVRTRCDEEPNDRHAVLH
jgi:hypothetical protein